QAVGGARLAAEAGDELGVLAELAVQDLERVLAAQVHVLGEPDLAHAARAEPRDDAVALVQHLTDHGALLRILWHDSTRARARRLRGAGGGRRQGAYARAAARGRAAGARRRGAAAGRAGRRRRAGHGTRAAGRPGVRGAIVGGRRGSGGGDGGGRVRERDRRARARGGGASDRTGATVCRRRAGARVSGGARGHGGADGGADSAGGAGGEDGGGAIA